MIQINQNQQKLIKKAIVYFGNHVSDTVDKPLRHSLGFRPQSLQTFFEKVKELNEQVGNRKEIDKKFLPILKTALIHYRLSVAEDVLKKSCLTYCEEVRDVLEENLNEFSEVFNESWFEASSLTDEFEITNFVSIQHAVKLSFRAELKKRKYDEKFHILNAPELFSDDLSYYRFQCGIRKVHVNVAYIDIDKFKDFNSKYGESRVDKEILPKFMSEIDAFLYNHGFAYRYGGDEYVVIIPNMSLSDGVEYLRKLQNKISELSFFGITDKLQVSIGMVGVNKDTFYTNQEIEERAVFAKNFAKANGRNCIAIIDSHLLKDDDVKIANDDLS